MSIILRLPEEMSIILRLPEEIQEEVILKLPVKSIFTCKCVCKVLCNLISSSESVRDHINLASSNTNLSSYIFVNKSSLCYVEYDLENDEQLGQRPTEELFNLSGLGYFKEEDINIVGSCNGLVCLTTKINKYLCDHVYVCNPITGEFVELPRLVQNSKYYEVAGFREIFYGFGYLPSSNEYKVVRISYKSDSIHITPSGDVHVYTLGEGRGWRVKGKKIHTYFSFCMSEFQSIYVDGALYWVRYASREIVVFDLTFEKFYMLPPPPRLPCDYGKFYMVVLGGQLCLFQAALGNSANIWFLKKNMNNKSDGRKVFGVGKLTSWIWIKESTVTITGIGFKPLTITKNGDILLMHKEEWNQEQSKVVIRYNPKTTDSKELGDLGLPLPLPGYSKATVYVNRYISLKSIGEQTVFARL